jgi:hypothetical protein
VFIDDPTTSLQASAQAASIHGANKEPATGPQQLTYFFKLYPRLAQVFNDVPKYDEIELCCTFLGT